LMAGLSAAGDDTGTNQMPGAIHNLMETEGYTVDQPSLGGAKANTNSLRNLPFIEMQQFPPLESAAKKTGWSLLNNTNFKRVGRTTDQVNFLSPGSALSHYEYDITYSFVF